MAFGRDYKDAARSLRRLGHTYEEIETMLKGPGGDGPSLRTIQSWMLPEDKTRWTLADSEPEDATFALAMIAYLVMATEGKKRHLTQKEAQWVARVRKAEPWLTRPDIVWAVAMAYLEREQEQKDDADFSDLDYLTGNLVVLLNLQAVSKLPRILPEMRERFKFLWPNSPILAGGGDHTTLDPNVSKWTLSFVLFGSEWQQPTPDQPGAANTKGNQASEVGNV